jgi:hypothetical protein
MSERAAKAIQDFYPDDFAHCYGCGWLNVHDLQPMGTAAAAAERTAGRDVGDGGAGARSRMKRSSRERWECVQGARSSSSPSMWSRRSLG